MSRIYAQKLAYCQHCKHRWFDVRPGKTCDSECFHCDKQRRDKDVAVRKFAADNDMDPVPDGQDYPWHLPQLSEIEEMLIAQVHVIMKCYRLQNGSIGYKGQVLNMEQDVQGMVNSLPLRPETAPIVWIRKPTKKKNDGNPAGFKDFRVRRWAISLWLQFLTKNNPLYSHVTIDNEVLKSLPNDGDISHRIKVVDEDSLNDESTEEEEDVEDDERCNGTSAASATSGQTLEDAEGDDVRDSYLALPMEDNSESDEDKMRRILLNNFGKGSKNDPIAYPESGDILNDYKTPNLQALAFPTLFPFGAGDVMNQDRQVGVTMTESNTHLLKYAIFDKKKKIWVYPFARHPRWMHWAHNTCERHRVNGQRSYYLKNSPQDANLTEADLADICEEDGDRLKSLIGRMQAFNANIRGSNSFFYKKRKELEALITTHGMPTMWFTFSAADNHWLDFARCIYGGDLPAFQSVKEAAAWRRKLIRENPHLVDALFQKRVNSMLDAFFGPTGLKLKYHWCRIEYQKRGTAHVHGCLRLVDDPGLTGLAEKVLRGRMAAKFLRDRGQLPQEFEYDDGQDLDDEWHEEEASPSVSRAPDEQVALLLETIKEGKQSHKVIACLHDFLLQTDTEFFPADGKQRVRDKNTNFEEARFPQQLHPSAVDARDLDSDTPAVPFDDFSSSVLGAREFERLFASVDFTQKENLDRASDFSLQCAVCRHMHNAYCSCKIRKWLGDRQAALKKAKEAAKKEKATTVGTAKKKKKQPKALDAMYSEPVQKQGNKDCRFSYRLMLAALSHVRIREFVKKGKDGKEPQRKFRIDMIGKREKDQWINSFMPGILRVWRGNLDMQLVLDAGKVVEYMTKYVTKPESGMSKGASRLIRNVFQTAEDGQGVTSTLKRTMGKLLGERVMSQQEVSHLMLLLPMVECSHQFVNIHLDSDTNKIEIGNDEDNTKTESKKLSGKKKPLKLMRIPELYGRRMMVSSWYKTQDFEQCLSELEHMTLEKFVTTFHVGVRDPARNRIVKNRKNNLVGVFYPTKSSDPSSSGYVDYCRYSLAKYKPWTGEMESVWGGKDASRSEIIRNWNSFCDELEASGQELPDMLRRELDTYRQNCLLFGQSFRDPAEVVDDGTVFDGGTAQKDDWMFGCDDLGIVPSYDMLDPSDVAIKWDTDHDWSQRVNEIPELNNIDALEVQYNELMQLELQRERLEFLRSNLNTRQKLAHDAICRATCLKEGESITDGGTDISRLMILTGVGGTGKSKVVDAIFTTLKKEHGYAVGSEIGNFATTGKAASVNDGSTIHNYGQGLGLPQKEYFDLKGGSLTSLQKRYANLKVIFIDEFSMLRQKELFAVDKRLRQIKCQPDLLFGGVTVVLCGDPGQLPPVKAELLWDGQKVSGKKLLGYCLYMQFESVVRLDENKRVDMNDPRAVYFIEFLLRLWDGECTEGDWVTVRDQCSYYKMGVDKWKRRGFDNPHLTHLYTTNADVDVRNLSCLQQLGKPIALIEAAHTGRGKSFTDDYAQGLHCQLYVCEDARVMLIANICTSVGLCNGATGVVIETVYDKSPPGLPRCVIVDFGERYKGPRFFAGEGRESWVPVFPKTVEWGSAKKDGSETKHSRTMIPLKLSWAMTIWKAQGQTIDDQVVLKLGKTEREVGLAHTAFSRACRLSDVGLIDGLTRERLCQQVKKHKRLSPRKREEKRLGNLFNKLALKMKGLDSRWSDFDLEEKDSTNVTDPVLPLPEDPVRDKVDPVLPVLANPVQERAIVLVPDVVEPPQSPFAPLSREEQNSVHRFISSHGPDDEIVAQVGMDTVQRASIHRLQDRRLLNDELLQLYISLLRQRDLTLCRIDQTRRHSHFFTSFFITQLVGAGADEYCFQRVERFHRHVPGGDLFELELVFVPVNLTASHWFLVVVFVQEKRIQVYDSIGDSYREYARTMLCYLDDVHKLTKGSPLPDIENWSLIGTARDTPKQTNGECFNSLFFFLIVDCHSLAASSLLLCATSQGFDCGVFTLMFADFLSVGRPLLFAQDDMPRCRARIALAILNGSIEDEIKEESVEAIEWYQSLSDESRRSVDDDITAIFLRAAQRLSNGERASSTQD